MSSQYSDGYANLITGLGTARDKSRGAALYRDGDLDQTELDTLYEQDALAARIVDRIVDDATRSGFDIDCADEGFDVKSVKSQVEDLQVLNESGDAWRWSRLYGGSLLFYNVNDGKKMSEPMDLNAVTKLISLQVIESPYVRPSSYNPGLGARAFRNPERYDIFVPFGRDSVRTIHRSRVVRFDGVRVPPTRMISRGGWGPSVLDRVVRELTQLGEVLGYSRNIMHELSIMILRITGFRDQVCGNAEQQAEIKKVIEAMRWAVDNLHTLTLDKADEYGESQRTVSGLAELLRMYVDALARSTDYPAMIILNSRGEGSGLANSAGSELATYYDTVDARRKAVLIPAINKALEIIFAVRSKSEPVPDEWTIEFPSLYQPTDKERSETELRDAQRDQILLTYGIKSADEARDERIRAGQIIPIEGLNKKTKDVLDAITPALLARVQAGEFSEEDAAMLARILGGRPLIPFGLDQPFPARAADDLSRAFTTLDARALAVIERVLVPAIDSADSAEIDRALKKVEAELRGFGDSIETAAREVGDRVNLSHRRLFFEGVRLALGPNYAVLGSDQGRAELPFPGDEPAAFAGKTVLVVKPNAEIGALVDLFVTENVKLVSTLEAGIADALRDQVVREVTFGSGDPRELRERLLRQWRKKGVPSRIPTKRRTKAGKTITVSVESHADLIARDQLAKLNLALTRSRQVAAGISHATWRDRDDSKVRPEHRALDGRVFAWSEGVPGVGYPGEPVSCRCHAEAVLEPASVLEARGFEVVPPAR